MDKSKKWEIKGDKYYSEGEYNKAIDAYKHALEINPKNSVIWNNLGAIYSYNKDFSKAIEAFEKALEIDPDVKEIWGNISYLYLKKGDFSKSIDASNQALEIDSNNFEAWNYLCQSYYYKGDYEKAIEKNLHVLSLEPQERVFWFNLIACYIKKGNFEKAIESCKNVFETDWQIKFINFKKADYINSINLIENSLDIGLEYCELWYYLARFYLDAILYEEAKNACDNSLKCNPNFEDTIELNKKLIKLSDKTSLRVFPTERSDFGPNIIRINQKMMEDLKIIKGDVVSITGKKESTGIAWPGFPNDSEKGIIRIGSLLMKNTQTTTNDLIEIKKVAPKVANLIILAPLNLKLRSSHGLEPLLKKELINYPITLDDIVSVPIGRGREVEFKVIKLVPESICKIENQTIIKIGEDIIDKRMLGIEYTTYGDIGGIDDIIEKVRELVELPLQNPSFFHHLGITPPKGILLKGPPGCGKTLLVRAIANETKAHFISIDGPEIMAKFYGEPEKKLRKLFNEAEVKSPSIIYIDKIDSIALKIKSLKKKEVEKRVVSQLLTLMDGLHQRGRVIVIGETNRPEEIDEALRRPGRFDHEIELGIPDLDGRYQILLIRTRKMPLHSDINLKSIAEKTEGFVGADISALCRTAAMKALRRYTPKIDFELGILEQKTVKEMQIKAEDFNEALEEILPSYSQVENAKGNDKNKQ